jgi:hypothetical protein
VAVELQGRGRLRRGLAAVLIALAPAAAAAQSEAPAVTASYEAAYDRFHYYFENPSSFDMGLVPHNFKQTYWADNHWAIVTARYRIAGIAMETEFGATPSRATRGDDVDTFFQSNGDVVTSGTSGQVDLQSWRVRYAVTMGVAGGLTWHGGYQFRRDRSEFHPEQTKTVTHSQPPSSEAFTIVGAETTISDLHEVRVGVSRGWTPSGGWRIRARVDAAPTTHARLTTILPIKYPGREILFAATVLTINPSLTVSHGERWPIAASIAWTGTFSYLESSQFKRNAATIAIGFGRSF